jgi:hypothetical protein
MLQCQITSDYTHLQLVAGIQAVWLVTAPHSTRRWIHKEEGWLTLTHPRGGKRPCPVFVCLVSYFGGGGSQGATSGGVGVTCLAIPTFSGHHRWSALAWA